MDRHIKQEILDCCRSVQYGLNFNTQGNISAALCLGQPHILSYAELNLPSAP